MERLELAELQPSLTPGQRCMSTSAIRMKAPPCPQNTSHEESNPGAIAVTRQGGTTVHCARGPQFLSRK